MKILSDSEADDDVSVEIPFILNDCCAIAPQRKRKSSVEELFSPGTSQWDGMVVRSTPTKKSTFPNKQI